MRYVAAAEAAVSVNNQSVSSHANEYKKYNRCQEEGSNNGGILLPHKLVDHLAEVATQNKQPALMGGDFARLAQSCQEVRCQGFKDLKI